MRVEGLFSAGLSLLLLAACQREGRVRGNPLEGAWLVVDVRFGSGGAETDATKAQPGQFIFTPTRYSAVWVTQSEPRPLSASRFQPTQDEMVAHYRSVAANSGAYEVSGARLTIRPIVAKLPDFVRGHLTYEFRITGDTLFLEAIDEKTADGIAPPNYEATREKLKLVRIE
jgi:hypothetical protein